MNAHELVSIAIQGSMAMIVFCVGLDAGFGDVRALLHRPGLLARSLISMYVVVPAIATVLAMTFNLRPALEIALVALALSPVPPVLPGKEFKARGSASYVVGLLAVSGLVAIVFVPAALEVLGRLFDRPAHVPMRTVARIVAVSVLAPLLAGATVRHFAPGIAERLSRPLSIAGTVVLVLAFLPGGQDLARPHGAGG